MSGITARGIGVRYDGRVALEGVDLDVAAGEWAALVGPNGAGKSSLLRALAGTVPATGTVAVGGAPATRCRGGAGPGWWRPWPSTRSCPPG